MWKNIKKSCDLFDKIVWIIIFFMPFVLYAIALNKNPDLTLQGFFHNSIGVMFVSSSFNDTLFTLFQQGNGFFDFFEDFILLEYVMCWMFILTFAHVMLDVLLFIPRWFHGFLRRFDYD